MYNPPSKNKKSQVLALKMARLSAPSRGPEGEDWAHTHISRSPPHLASYSKIEIRGVPPTMRNTLFEKVGPSDSPNNPAMKIVQIIQKWEIFLTENRVNFPGSLKCNE